MTTIFWMRINGSLRDIIHILQRVELLDELMYLKLPEHGIEIPRISNKITKMVYSELPNRKKICDIVAIAREHAIFLARSFGIENQVIKRFLIIQIS